MAAAAKSAADAPAASPKLLHVDAIQTAPPGRMSEPGQSRRIAVDAGRGPLDQEALQSRFRIVLYYDKVDEEESPLLVAAWMKESLSKVLPENPVLSGRLRKGGDGADKGGWEVKFNDSGVRLVQATAEMSMSEFLACKNKEEREGHLAYWVDIDGDNPDFCALFYIQVTQFQGDGYAIGISCSLLLVDPLYLTRFLESWVQSYTKMRAHGHLAKTSIFHLSLFQRSGRPIRLKSVILESPAPDHSTATVLFKVSPAAQSLTSSYNELASACLEEAARRLEVKPVSNYTLMVNEHVTGNMNVGVNLATSKSHDANGLVNVAWWDEFDMEDLAFNQGNKPVHVSYRIVSGSKEGLVVVMIPCDGEAYISTTIPK